MGFYFLTETQPHTQNRINTLTYQYLPSLTLTLILIQDLHLSWAPLRVHVSQADEKSPPNTIEQLF